MAIAPSTWAIPTSKLHVIDNLNAKEESLAKKILEKNGFLFSKSPLFSESSHAIVITKSIGDSQETASIQVEVMKKEANQAIPSSIFQIKLETENIEEVLEKLPNLKSLDSTPVAFQN